MPNATPKQILTLAAAVFVTTAFTAWLTTDSTRPALAQRSRGEIHVDFQRGKDRAKGTARSPLKTISAAIARLPDPLTQSMDIHIKGAPHTTTGGQGMLEDTLELHHRMKPGVHVRLLGERKGGVILDWQSSRRPYLITVTEGHWILESLQIGSRKDRQRQGLSASGAGLAELINVTVRTKSLSGAGIRAGRGGQIWLRGVIALNEDFHDAIPGDESFAGIVAEEHAIVQFKDRNGSLSIGNGSLMSSYFGCIRLGCKTAKITSWSGQGNPIAVNNSGRVDLHGTTTTLRPTRASNTPIGLEDDGHVLAEGAHIIIESVKDGSGIVLQKSSALYCQDIEFRGTPRYTLIAYSGSNFVGDFRGEVHDVHATTGSTIAIGGKPTLVGPFQATKGGTLSLPDGRVLRE